MKTLIPSLVMWCSTVKVSPSSVLWGFWSPTCLFVSLYSLKLYQMINWASTQKENIFIPQWHHNIDESERNNWCDTSTNDLMYHYIHLFSSGGCWGLTFDFYNLYYDSWGISALKSKTACFLTLFPDSILLGSGIAKSKPQHHPILIDNLTTEAQ